MSEQHTDEPPGSTGPTGPTGDAATTATVEPEAPAAPAAPSPLRRLRRSSSDRVIGGVCGGLGEAFAVDPVIFRVLAVVLALTGGAGVLVYAVAWLLVPDDGGVPRGGDRAVTAAWLLPLTLVAAAMLWWHPWSRGPGPGAPLFLAAAVLGFFVWRDQQARRVGGAAPARAPAAEGPPPAPAWWSAPEPAAPAPAMRPPSVLAPVTLSALLVLAGIAVATGMSAETTLALAVLVVGLALVAGAWFGRARILLPVGLVLVLAAAATSWLDVPLEGGVGEREWRVSSPALLAPSYRLAAGEALLDLSDLPVGEGTRRVEASVGFGELRVIVPADATVDVRAHADGGRLEVFGDVDEGTDVETRVLAEGSGRSPGRLVLGLEVGLGEVEVTRAAA